MFTRTLGTVTDIPYTLSFTKLSLSNEVKRHDRIINSKWESF